MGLLSRIQKTYRAGGRHKPSEKFSSTLPPPPPQPPPTPSPPDDGDDDDDDGAIFKIIQNVISPDLRESRETSTPFFARRSLLQILLEQDEEKKKKKRENQNKEEEEEEEEEEKEKEDKCGQRHKMKYSQFLYVRSRDVVMSTIEAWHFQQS
eukprot:TCALIF_05877-PA protein Name:"Protein of unknown function" AED:0.80 eAED:0.80 QI:0/0/0/0.2/1/1/5/0/151